MTAVGEPQAELNTIYPFGCLSLSEGKISFQNMVRLDPGGALIFRVDLPARPPMYGLWNQIPSTDDTGWNAEIVRFGYFSKNAVGDQRPGARLTLSVLEGRVVEALVRVLFATPEMRNRTFPFMRRPSAFFGVVTFALDWVVLAAK